MDNQIYNQNQNEAQAPLKHSGLGIVSFIISLIIGMAEFILVIIAGVLTLRPGGLNERSAEAIILGLFMIAGLMVNLVGIGLGIAGILQKNRKSVFSILGLVLNSGVILGLIFLWVAGSAA